MDRNRRGFTLIELLVVITVIGILVSIITFAFFNIKSHARDDRRKADVQKIGKGLELYYGDNGSFPASAGAWTLSTHTASWDSFSTTLRNASTIDEAPLDPTNSGSTLPGGNGLMYAYSSTGVCGKPAGQAYVIVYRLEASSQVSFIDGACPNASTLSSYSANGLSYYAVIR